MSDQRTSSYRTVLGNESFRWLWLAVLLSRAGEAIAQVAMPLLVYDLTASSRLLGAMLVVQTAPRVLLAPIAGLLADRVDRRRTMIGAAALRTVSVALIPLTDEVWQIAVLAAVISVGMALSMPAELSALPLTVPANQLVRALSLTQVTNSGMRIIGPALGAGLVGSAGIAAAFWTEAGCFALAIACLRPLHIPAGPKASPTRGAVFANAKREIVDGLRTVWQTPIVRGVTATESLWSLIGAATSIAGLVFLSETLELGDRTEFVYGLLAASMSAGAMSGALAAHLIELRVGRPALLALGYLGPLFVLPVLIEPPLGVLFGCWFLFGAADALAVIAMQAYLAEAVEPNLRGRVYATWNGVVTFAWMVCYGTIGWITDRAGPSLTIAAAGLIVGAGGPLVLLATGALRSVRSSRPVTLAADRL